MNSLASAGVRDSQYLVNRLLYKSIQRQQVSDPNTERSKKANGSVRMWHHNTQGKQISFFEHNKVTHWSSRADVAMGKF